MDRGRVDGYAGSEADGPTSDGETDLGKLLALWRSLRNDYTSVIRSHGALMEELEVRRHNEAALAKKVNELIDNYAKLDAMPAKKFWERCEAARVEALSVRKENVELADQLAIANAKLNELDFLKVESSDLRGRLQRALNALGTESKAHEETKAKLKLFEERCKRADNSLQEENKIHDVELAKLKSDIAALATETIDLRMALSEETAKRRELEESNGHNELLAKQAEEAGKAALHNRVKQLESDVKFWRSLAESQAKAGRTVEGAQVSDELLAPAPTPVGTSKSTDPPAPKRIALGPRNKNILDYMDDDSDDEESGTKEKTVGEGGGTSKKKDGKPLTARALSAAKRKQFTAYCAAVQASVRK